MRRHYLLSIGGLTALSSLVLSLLFLYSFFGWGAEFGIALILAASLGVAGVHLPGVRWASTGLPQGRRHLRPDGAGVRYMRR